MEREISPRQLPPSFKLCRQLFLARSGSMDSHQGNLQLFERQGEKFQPVTEVIPCVFGKNGLAYTPERTGEKADERRTKKEGDMRTPMGVFWLGTAFGRVKLFPLDSKMPFLELHAELMAIDDPSSAYYNRMVDVGLLKEEKDWKSAEEMNRIDGLYDLGTVIHYNTINPQPGWGSCIFLHIWRGENQGTGGCVACSREDMRELIKRLNPQLHPGIWIKSQ